ncbi:hypothetical protein [Halobacillus sp. Marseille-P3879]|uniref:hypothetical protein n=1 Tax=Halobacillus sp. Marseille-P3879 TaxID=2045014 RepID=UPI000C7D981F|nr:hypothetical protein [Halobacillus sp. Marseille-P3879]
MNHYEKNYWALYFDFIELFSKEAPKGYPLVLLSHFYEHIKKIPALHTALKKETFERRLIHRLETEEQVQKFFEEYFPNGERKMVKGKIALHDHLLRFPPSVMNQFPPAHTLLIKNKSRSKKEKSGIPILSLKDYEQETEEMEKEYKEAWYRLFSKHSNHPLIGNAVFKKRLIKELPRLLQAVFAAESVMQKEKLNVLVLGTTNSCESRALALSARKYGIPSVCMQHGIIGLEFGYLPKAADYLAVYGHYELDWYIRKGIPADEIRITGHPRFDEIKNQKTAPLSKLGFNPRKATILFIHHHEEVSVPRAIIQSLTEYDTFQLIVKARGNPKEITKLQKMYPSVQLSAGIGLYDLIAAADIVVSYPSTVVLESLIANKPVFIWNIPGEPLPACFDSLQEMVHDHPVTLVKHILHHFREKKGIIKTEFLARHYPLELQQKKSTDVLLKLINDLKS